MLLDGGFVVKKLESENKRFPDSTTIADFCKEIQTQEVLENLELLRIFFYHARPAQDDLTNPIDRSITRLSQSQVARNHESLLDKLELSPDFALRLGEAVVHGWKIGERATDSLRLKARKMRPNDLVPNITQKGVDLRVGLDIARLALGQMVRAVVVITGDSDFVPAFRFARREGLRVYLHSMGHGVRRDLKAHVDRVIG